MSSINFTVPGLPKGKQRPKVTMCGSYAHAYTPKETVEYETYIKVTYREQVNTAYKGQGYLKGPLKAEILAFFPVPKSTSNKQRALMLANVKKYTKKPDCDNLGKTILDALNGIAYDDDSQVCELSVKKMYGEVPRVVVYLTELEEQGS